MRQMFSYIVSARQFYGNLSTSKSTRLNGPVQWAGLFCLWGILYEIRLVPTTLNELR